MIYPRKAPFAALESQLRRHGIEKRTIAAWMGVSPSGLSYILRGNRRPTPLQAYNLVGLTKFLESRDVSRPRLPLYQPIPKRQPVTEEVPNV